MNALEWFLKLHELCNFQTKEGTLVGKASNFEIRRWFQNGAIQINNIRININDILDLQSIESIILFPNNKKAKITLW